MMITKPMALLAAMTLVSLLGTSARADLTVTATEGAFHQSFTLTGSPTSDLTLSAPTTLVVGDYTIKVLGSEANQITSDTQLLSSSTSITKTGFGTGTLTVTITGTGFTNPTTPPPVAVLTSIGGSVSVSHTGDTLSYLTSVAGTAVGPALTPTVVGVPSYNVSQAATVSSLSAPFSITQTINVDLTSFNDKLGYQAQTNLTATATPEPSSLAIAGLSALGMIGYGLRRRKAKSA